LNAPYSYVFNKRKTVQWSSRDSVLGFCYSAVKYVPRIFISIYYIHSLEVCNSCHSQPILISPYNLPASTNASIEVLNLEDEMPYEIEAVILLTVIMCRSMNICFILFVNNVTLYRTNLNLFNYRYICHSKKCCLFLWYFYYDIQLCSVYCSTSLHLNTRLTCCLKFVSYV
jgi:hypothetical protein